MNRRSVMMIAATVAAGAALMAQENPLSTEARQAWTRTKNNLVAAAEKMPEENYAFKPAPESQSFGDLIAHSANSALAACSALTGERKQGTADAKGSKADLVAALKAAAAECDKAHEITDAQATQMIAGGRGGQRSRLAALYGNTIHMEHEYAQMAVHFRLKGLVPPSSEGRGGGRGRGGN